MLKSQRSTHRTSWRKSSSIRLLSFTIPPAMSLDPEFAPPLLRTPMIGMHPSMKKALHAVQAASGVLDSWVEPNMRISLCEPLQGGRWSCSRTVKKGPRIQSGAARCVAGISLHGVDFDSYIRCWNTRWTARSSSDPTRKPERVWSTRTATNGTPTLEICETGPNSIRMCSNLRDAYDG